MQTVFGNDLAANRLELTIECHPVCICTGLNSCKDRPSAEQQSMRYRSFASVQEINSVRLSIPVINWSSETRTCLLTGPERSKGASMWQKGSSLHVQLMSLSIEVNAIAGQRMLPKILAATVQSESAV